MADVLHRILRPSISSMRQAADAVRSEPGPNARLWYWEDRLGRPLLDVRIDHATIFPPLLRRELPLEEKQLDPNSDLARKLESLPF